MLSWEWCIELVIKFKYFSPAHPQSNGQVEMTNKTLMGILKKGLGDKKGRWEEELPGVLWTYQTTIKTPIEETPFALTYDSEVVIPMKIGMPTYQVQNFDPNLNSEGLKENLNLLEERWHEATIRTMNN